MDSDALVRLALLPLLSGAVLFAGLLLLGAGPLAPPRVSRVAVWSGLLLALVSAAPIPTPFYVALAGAAVLWSWSRAHPTPRRQSLAHGALALAALAAGVTEAPWTLGRTVTLPPGRVVMVVGDSLAAGPGAWPDAYAAAGGCAVSNVARPGAPLSEGLRQLERVPNAGGIALVELGGHDLLRNSPHDRFAQDLDTLLVALQSRGCQVVLLELPLLPFQNGYGRVQRRLAEARGAALVPRRVLATALTLPGHTTDGLHLSARGHAWLGRELARWVRCDAGAGT